jgi:hypothetical protein
VSKEQFLYNETKPVFELIEEASQRSGVGRGQAFEDFLHMSVCAMSGGTMEDQYLHLLLRVRVQFVRARPHVFAGVIPIEDSFSVGEPGKVHAGLPWQDVIHQ